MADGLVKTHEQGIKDEWCENMASKLEKTKYLSADGKTNITAYIWTPDDAPVCGVVQIIHGMREHMGRYADFAAFLNAKGYAVCGDDHLGHGETASEAGKYGHFGEKDGAKNIVRDCRKLTQLMQKKFPDTPYFVLGHSMGSFIGRLYIVGYSENISGFICMGTGGENPLAPMGRLIAEGMIRMGKGDKTGKLLDKIAFGGFNKGIPDAVSKNAWLTRDAEIVEAYDKDAHVKELFSNHGFRDLLDLQIAATGSKWAEQAPKNLPILIVSGTKDPVGDYSKGVTKVYEQLKSQGAENVSLKLYPDARHEILNETNKHEVYGDILDWMEELRGVGEVAVSGE